MDCCATNRIQRLGLFLLLPSDLTKSHLRGKSLWELEDVRIETGDFFEAEPAEFGKKKALNCSKGYKKNIIDTYGDYFMD